MIYITAWTCTNATASTTNCVATATTTETATTTLAVPYGDWIFINGIIIFLLAVIPTVMWFSVWKSKRK